MPTVGSVFDVRTFDHVSVLREQGATYSELGIGAVGPFLCCSLSAFINKLTTAVESRPRCGKDEPWIAAPMIF
jgi:hypothetical protein